MNIFIKILFLFLLTQVSAQVSLEFSINKLDSQPLVATSFIGKDKFGYDYYLDNNTLFKKNKEDVFEYKNLEFGKITSIDIHNPLKIIVFYRDFNSIVTLDNQLNESNRLFLSDFKSNIIVDNVGMASRNKLWVYNLNSQKIGLLDLISRSHEEVSTPLKNNIIWSKTDFNNFWWVDANNDLFECSIFGKTKKVYKIPNFYVLQVLDKKNALYSDKNKLFLINFQNSTILEVYQTEESIVDFSFKNQILSIFTNQQLFNFKLIIP